MNHDTDLEVRLRRALTDLASRGAPTAAEIRARMSAPRPTDSSPAHGSGRGLPLRSTRSAFVMLLAAASVAVVLVTGTLLGNGAGTSRRSETPPAAGPTPSLIDHPRIVGRGRVVISVPGDWSTSAVRCGTPVAKTVVFDFQASRACVSGALDFDSVTIGSASVHPQFRRVETTTATGGTFAVFASQPDRQGELTMLQLWVPAEDAWFMIRTHDPALATAIASTVRVIPDDKTTMPDIFQGATGGMPGYSAAPDPTEVELRLAKAHLAAQVRFAGDATATHWSALTADPQPGSVLDAGTTVVVTYSVGDKGP